MLYFIVIRTFFFVAVSHMADKDDDDDDECELLIVRGRNNKHSGIIS